MTTMMGKALDGLRKASSEDETEPKVVKRTPWVEFRDDLPLEPRSSHRSLKTASDDDEDTIPGLDGEIEDIPKLPNPGPQTRNRTKVGCMSEIGEYCPMEGSIQ